jgi:hypothetical protein
LTSCTSQSNSARRITSARPIEAELIGSGANGRHSGLLRGSEPRDAIHVLRGSRHGHGARASPSECRNSRYSMQPSSVSEDSGMPFSATHHAFNVGNAPPEMLETRHSEC